MVPQTYTTVTITLKHSVFTFCYCYSCRSHQDCMYSWIPMCNVCSDELSTKTFEVRIISLRTTTHNREKENGRVVPHNFHVFHKTCLLQCLLTVESYNLFECVTPLQRASYFFFWGTATKTRQHNCGRATLRNECIKLTTQVKHFRINRVTLTFLHFSAVILSQFWEILVII